MSSTETSFNLHVAYQRTEAIDALNTLGITKNLGVQIPSLSQVLDLYTPEVRDFLGARAERDIQDQLVIAPQLSVHEGGLSLQGLVSRFDKGQQASGATFVNHYPWLVPASAREDSGYSYLDHNSAYDSAWQIGVILGDIEDPREPGKPASPVADSEPGLVYAGMSFEDQKKALECEAEVAAVSSITPITVSQMVTLHALARATGTTRPDNHQYEVRGDDGEVKERRIVSTRFAGYPEYHMTPDDVWAPTTFYDRDHSRLVLGGTSATDLSPVSGVRRALALNL